MKWGASQAGEEPAFRPLKLDWRFELLAAKRSGGGGGQTQAGRRRHERDAGLLQYP